MSNQSREAFIRQIASGKRETNMTRVYAHLGESHFSLDQMRTHFGKEIAHQTLTSVLSSLCDYGVIAQNSLTGRFHKEPEHRWVLNAKRREDERYEKWFNLGVKNDWHRRARLDDIDSAISKLKAR